MAKPEKAPKAPKDPNAPKKKQFKSALKVEIERVAKATGIPAKSIERRVAEQKGKLDADYKAAIAALTSSVASVVAESLKASAEAVLAKSTPAPQ